ncbi:MAG: DUF1353 domain-containing protein [Helicobacteraceae bacterium]|jgi:hypothetical protein|nr:DUF1353 domain-containing protein [Helicobacteraceae bacterium]
MKLILTPYSKGEFQLVKAFVRNGIEVPAGFVFDGASIPRPLWTIFAPHEYLTSSVTHDYGYAMATELYDEGYYVTGLRSGFRRLIWRSLGLW